MGAKACRHGQTPANDAEVNIGIYYRARFQIKNCGNESGNFHCFMRKNGIIVDRKENFTLNVGERSHSLVHNFYMPDTTAIFRFTGGHSEGGSWIEDYEKTVTLTPIGGECTTGCEVSCESTCEASCQSYCESHCKTGCEISCQSGCQGSCQTGCESGCESSCETGCQSGCELATKPDGKIISFTIPSELGTGEDLSIPFTVKNLGKSHEILGGFRIQLRIDSMTINKEPDLSWKSLDCGETWSYQIGTFSKGWTMPNNSVQVTLKLIDKNLGEQDTLTRMVVPSGCQTACELGCQTACEASCQSGCEISCESSCEISCQSKEETAAEPEGYILYLSKTQDLLEGEELKVPFTVKNIGKPHSWAGLGGFKICLYIDSVKYDTEPDTHWKTLDYNEPWSGELSTELSYPLWSMPGHDVNVKIVLEDKEYGLQDDEEFTVKCLAGGCTTVCEVSCESGCEVSCETGCESGCQSGCELGCETGCETSAEACTTEAEVPDISTCPICVSPLVEDGKFSDLQYNHQVKAGDNYHIGVDIVSLADYVGDKFFVHAQVDGECLYSSGNFTLAPGTMKHLGFGGVMPDHDITIRMSLWDENIFPVANDCEDYKEFAIKLGDETILPEPDEKLPTLLIVVGIVIAGVAVYFYTKKK